MFLNYVGVKQWQQEVICNGISSFAKVHKIEHFNRKTTIKSGSVLIVMTYAILLNNIPATM